MAARARAHRHPSRWLPSLLPLLLGAGVCLGPAARISQAQTIIASPGTTGLATVVTDTTTTQPTRGSTVNYVITGGLPTTGNALIHSFAQFDLGPGTTATFDLTGGPSRITAIWGRILSGSQSSLQGTISVHSPLGNNVDLALINPFGFVLGTGFNANGINALTLLAAPQAFAQLNADNAFLDLLSTATSSPLTSASRLAGAAYSTQAELGQSSITYASSALAIKQLNLMAAKIDFTPTSVLKTDILRIVAPWFVGGINFGSSGAGLASLTFGNYTPATYAYSFTRDDAVVTTAVAADPTYFLLTRDSLYTASSSKLSAPGSVQFNGAIEPYSASTLDAFLVARQAYIALQPSASSFTSPFGDYATTDLTGTPYVSGAAGFSVMVLVDPLVGAYQAPSPPLPRPSTAPVDRNGLQPGPGLNQDAATLVAALPIPQPPDDSFAPGKRRDGPQRPAVPGVPSAQVGSGFGAEIAISASSAGVGGLASSLPTVNPALSGAPMAASVTLVPSEPISTMGTSESINRFNAAELSITHDTAKALGVADGEALTPAQLQKLLQAATVSMRKRHGQAHGTTTPASPGPWQDESSLLAAKPGSTVSDVGTLSGYFAALSYNPVILSIRYSEAKGRTANTKADAFLDYTLIPAEGPIIGHRLELASSHFAGLLKQLYGSLSRQEPLNVADRDSASRQLHGLLIGPVAEQLRNQKVTTILIAADRGLQGVPFAALHDGQQFFGDRYAFALTPALSLTDLKLQDDTTKRLLTFGASQFNEGLAPLPLVPQELEKISALKTSEALLNRLFTPKSLLGAAGDPLYDWIHVATHAEFLPGGPSQSRLFTGTDPLPLSAFAGLRKTRQGRPIDLFTLSACRTALGDSESELGFAGLAIQAGARSAIGTLWYVDDVATSAYFIQVYRYLKQGLPKAEALQATRRDFSRGRIQLAGNKLIAADGELLLDQLSVPQQRRVASGLSNPYFWAGIEMVGSPW